VSARRSHRRDNDLQSSARIKPGWPNTVIAVSWKEPLMTVTKFLVIALSLAALSACVVRPEPVRVAAPPAEVIVR
jgi:hypothetical protein